MPFPVEQKWIREAEAILETRFPASFVVEMAQKNGGAVESPDDHWELFPFWDKSNRDRLKRTCNSIDRETASAREGWLGFPKTGVAIGTNGCGDLLVLMPSPDCSNTLQHTVYWWDHETSELNHVSDDFCDLTRI